MRRLMMPVVLASYCIAILLLLDFVYSKFSPTDATEFLRVPDVYLHHALARNFNGLDLWHGLYRVRTNSLGFKDAAERNVPLSAGNRRILLIGDSFAEGLGLPFEQTFAGLLYRAGQNRPDKIEFLNGGVTSYSPTLYYRQIKALLDRGFRFDEVIVISDISDVGDEATSYFCEDEDPRYRSFCGESTVRPFAEPEARRTWLQKNFSVIDRTIKLARTMVRYWREGEQETWSNTPPMKPAMRWTVREEGEASLFPPLGIEGGIARSLRNMQSLADLLAGRRIPLTIVVYPWPAQLVLDDRDSRQVSIWRDFCRRNCKDFIDLFPAFFAEKSAHADWYERLFIQGDVHFSAEGNQVFFRALWARLFEQASRSSRNEH